MKRITKIAIGLGTALALGFGAATVSAQPFGYGMGPGMMGGYGPGYGGRTGGYSMGWGGHMGGYGPGNGMGPGMMGGYGPGYGMGPQAMYGGNYADPDENLAALKSQLGISEKQEGAWQAFVDNAKKQNASRQAWFAKMQEARAAGSAPELLAQQTELLKQRQSELTANAAALKNLYAALTPEQRAIADQRFGGFVPGGNQGYRGPRGYAR